MKLVLTLIIMLSLSTAGAAETKPVFVKWSAKDTSGAAVTVPVADKSTVLAFVRADQPQSTQALEEIGKAVARDNAVQAIVIVSGDDAAEQTKRVVATGAKWPIVIDTDFAASGQMGVHVWPTTLVILPTGQQAAHLAGLPPTFALDLQAYLDFASKKVDGAGLAQRLTAREVVVQSPAQMASHQLQLAQQMLERADVDAARTAVEAGLKVQPSDAPLKLTLARVQILSKKPADALATLDSVTPGAVAAWQINVLRARALIDSDKWEQAKAVLADSVKLNPEPAEAHYLTGVVYQHANDAAGAAAEFRAAVETSPTGKRFALPTH